MKFSTDVNHISVPLQKCLHVSKSTDPVLYTTQVKIHTYRPAAEMCIPNTASHQQGQLTAVLTRLFVPTGQTYRSLNPSSTPNLTATPFVLNS